MTLSDHWPLFDLELRLGDVALRLPGEEELASLADLAARGVHAPGERPFLTPWAEGTPQERAREVLGGHWWRLGMWELADWRLGLGVFEAGVPVGMVTLRARDFAVLREVSTSSWIGVEHQGRGLGANARIALLALAFDHLGATDATTEVFPDNARSQGVSRRLGYEPDGISRDRRGDDALVSDRLRLTVTRWNALRTTRPAVEVRGLEAGRSLFG